MQVDFKPIGNSGDANVETQAQYEIDLGVGGSLQKGYQAGTAQSTQVNKTVRQCSMASAALATAIANILQVDVLDDGDLASLTAKLQLAMTGAAWSTGDAKLTYKVVADPGWILANDGTIGSAASGATYANDNAKALFILLWTNIIDAWAPVVTGRGGSALADWNANKKLTLTKSLGRAVAISGAGVGLTARVLGQNLGFEDATLVSHAHGGNTAGQSTDHTHAFGSTAWFGQNYRNPGGIFQGSSGDSSFADVINLVTSGASDDHVHPIAAEGSSAVGKNMPPETFFNVMLKL